MEPLKEDAVQRIDKLGLDAVVRRGHNVSMQLRYHLVGDYFLVYVRFNNRRYQVFTQRGAPRKFKHLRKALDWGKKMGFANAKLTVEYANYSLVDDGVEKEH